MLRFIYKVPQPKDRRTIQIVLYGKPAPVGSHPFVTLKREHYGSVSHSKIASLPTALSNALQSISKQKVSSVTSGLATRGATRISP